MSSVIADLRTPAGLEVKVDGQPCKVAVMSGPRRGYVLINGQEQDAEGRFSGISYDVVFRPSGAIELTPGTDVDTGMPLPVIITSDGSLLVGPPGFEGDPYSQHQYFSFVIPPQRERSQVLWTPQQPPAAVPAPQQQQQPAPQEQQQPAPQEQQQAVPQQSRDTANQRPFYKQKLFWGGVLAAAGAMSVIALGAALAGRARRRKPVGKAQLGAKQTK